MGGMGHGLLSTSPVIVDAFFATLRRQGLVAVVLLLLMGLGWAVLYWTSASGGSTVASSGGAAAGEPSGRRVLRLSFGLLWLLDGLLQMQPAMPLGMPVQVVQPAAESSPGWVQHLVSDGLSLWTLHPIPAAVSAVWVQIGIGLMLLFAPQGVWSRTAGWVSAGWALVVWVFGEAFGGVLGPGASWLFGAPGAALFYFLAGVILALPDRGWQGQRLGRLVLGVTGWFFLAMALLQSWPGRGFWQGQPTASATPGSLTSMVQDMSQTPQPRVFADLVSWFSRLDAQHGWAVNLVVVLALAITGSGLVVTGLRWTPGVARASVAGAVVLCLAVWVLVQDLGFFGGVGTDPNSMVPLVVLIVAGYVSGARPFQAADVLVAEEEPPQRQALGLKALVGLSTAGVVLLGAIPMAVASARPTADAILTEAVNGTPGRFNVAAAPFTLTDQQGRTVTLADLRGRAVVLTFLDPVCTTDCPIIAQQLRRADDLLGASAAEHALFVAVVANPIYRSQTVIRQFDQQEHLDSMANWLFLTGSLPSLERTWKDYAIQVQTPDAGSMVAHDEVAIIIDPSGRIRARIGSDPGGSGPTAQSLSAMIAKELQAVLPA